MSGGISIATNRRISSELSAYQIECGKTRPKANSFAVARQSALHHFRAFVVGNCDEDETHRLFRGAARRPGNSGNTDPEGRLGSRTDSFRQRNRNFAAYSSMFGDQLGGHAYQFGFQVVGVGHHATDEIAGTAGHGSETFGHHSTGAGLGDGQGSSAHLQKISDDLFERLATA